MSQTIGEHIDVIRRICDRGITHSLSRNESRCVDLFQHLLNEIDIMRKVYESNKTDFK
jgi:hypothetical protein